MCIYSCRTYFEAAAYPKITLGPIKVYVCTLKVRNSNIRKNIFLPNLNERPLRILFVAGALNGGGAERQLIQLVTELHKLGQLVTVATIASNNVDTEFQHVELWNGKRRTIVGTLWGLAGALFRLRGLCAAERPDVVVGWLSIPIVLTSIANWSNCIPFVASLRNSIPEQQSSRHREKLQYTLLRWSLRKANLIIANSQLGIESYTELGLIRKTPARVIRNGIDTRAFQSVTAHSANTARAALGISHQGPIALYVGRISAVKDIPLLVRVISASLDCQQNLLWLVVGITLEQFLAIASSINVNILTSKVFFIPRLNLMGLAYNASTMLCLTSTSEGSPNCVLEARACGIPVISTDCGDVREYMCPGDHVVAANPKAFTNAINEVLLPESQQIRHEAQVVSMNECAKLWLSALRSVIPAKAH